MILITRATLLLLFLQFVACMGNVEDRKNTTQTQGFQYEEPTEAYADYKVDYANVIEYEDRMIRDYERLVDDVRNERWDRAASDAEGMIETSYGADRLLGASDNETRYRRMSRLPYAIRSGNLRDTALIQQAVFYDRIWQIRQMLENANASESTPYLPSLRAAASILETVSADRDDQTQGSAGIAVAKIKALMMQVESQEISRDDAKVRALAALDDVMVGQRERYETFKRNMGNYFSEREAEFEAYSGNLYHKIRNNTSETAEAVRSVKEDEPILWTQRTVTAE